jgi:hypothetical protein
MKANISIFKEEKEKLLELQKEENVPASYIVKNMLGIILNDSDLLKYVITKSIEQHTKDELDKIYTRKNKSEKLKIKKRLQKSNLIKSKKAKTNYLDSWIA